MRNVFFFTFSALVFFTNVSCVCVCVQFFLQRLCFAFHPIEIPLFERRKKKEWQRTMRIYLILHVKLLLVYFDRIYGKGNFTVNTCMWLCDESQCAFNGLLLLLLLHTNIVDNFSTSFSSIFRMECGTCYTSRCSLFHCYLCDNLFFFFSFFFSSYQLFKKQKKSSRYGEEKMGFRFAYLSFQFLSFHSRIYRMHSLGRKSFLFRILLFNIVVVLLLSLPSLPLLL